MRRFLLLLFILTGCTLPMQVVSPTPQATQTSIPTATVTRTPRPTFTPGPTLTPDSLLLEFSPELTFVPWVVNDDTPMFIVCMLAYFNFNYGPGYIRVFRTDQTSYLRCVNES